MSAGVARLGPGSPMPSNPEEVDALLRRVPDVAFAPELEGCIFTAEALAGLAPFAQPAHLARLADASYLGELTRALDAVKDRARRENDGGLEFLASSLAHFVSKLPPEEHPLIVALWCRSWARKRGRDEVPAAVAAAMDEFESSRGSGG